jgi:hypothetical protein
MPGRLPKKYWLPIRFFSLCSALVSRGLSRTTGRPGNQYLVVDELSFGFASVLAIEALDAACRVDQLLFPGEKRVATRADLEPDLRLGGSRLPRLSTSAVYGRIHVLRMNIGFHF